MALILKGRITSVSSPLATFTFTDENSTLPLVEQYGQSGNPARANLGLFLYVTQKEVGSVADSIIHAGTDNGAPETADSWVVNYTEDNWFETILIAAEDWSVGQAYVTNDVVHHSNNLFIALQGSTGQTPGDPGSEADWELATSNHTKILSQGNNFWYTNADASDANDIVVAYAEVHYAQVIADNSKNGQCLLCDHDDKQTLDLIDFHLNAAYVSSFQELFTQAQYNIVTLKALCAK